MSWNDFSAFPTEVFPQVASEDRSTTAAGDGRRKPCHVEVYPRNMVPVDLAPSPEADQMVLKQNVQIALKTWPSPSVSHHWDKRNKWQGDKENTVQKTRLKSFISSLPMPRKTPESKILKR